MTTIKYGLTNQNPPRIRRRLHYRDLLADTNILGSLGAPESVRAICGGETLPSDASVNEYSTISLEKQASSKA